MAEASAARVGNPGTVQHNRMPLRRAARGIASPLSAVAPCKHSVFAPAEPDPSRSAFPHLLPPSNGASPKRWESYHQRRCEILAASRRMMGDVGFEGICVREIASQCAVSVPTVYNIVGDRAAIIRAASAEWTQWLGAAARPATPGGSQMLALLEAFWMSALLYPDYVAGAARICATPESPLIQTFQAVARRVFCDGLADLLRADMLRPWIDIESLSGQLTQSIQVGIGTWVLFPYDEAEFRREFAYGPGLMLLAAVRGDEADRVERALDGTDGASTPNI